MIIYYLWLLFQESTGIASKAGKEKVKINLSGRMGGRGPMSNLEFLSPYGEKKKVALIKAEFIMEFDVWKPIHLGFYMTKQPPMTPKQPHN